MRALGFGAAVALSAAAPVGAVEPVRTAEPVCDGQPSDVRLLISVDRVTRAEGQVAATIYPDDRHRFLAHHGQLAVVRRPSEATSTLVCAWLPAPGRYEVAVYQDLNGDGHFNRTRLGLPAEPYGLSNDPPTLLGLPSFRSVQFRVQLGDNTIHIPLHNAPAAKRTAPGS